MFLSRDSNKSRPLSQRDNDNPNFGIFTKTEKHPLRYLSSTLTLVPSEKSPYLDTHTSVNVNTSVHIRTLLMSKIVLRVHYIRTT